MRFTFVTLQHFPPLTRLLLVVQLLTHVVLLCSCSPRFLFFLLPSLSGCQQAKRCLVSPQNEAPTLSYHLFVDKLPARVLILTIVYNHWSVPFLWHRQSSTSSAGTLLTNFKALSEASLKALLIQAWSVCAPTSHLTLTPASSTESFMWAVITCLKNFCSHDDTWLMDC